MIDEKELLKMNERARKSLEIIWGYMSQYEIAVYAFGDVEKMVRYINENAGKETK